jgi:hypothetical protein
MASWTILPKQTVPTSARATWLAVACEACVQAITRAGTRSRQTLQTTATNAA